MLLWYHKNIVISGLKTYIKCLCVYAINIFYFELASEAMTEECQILNKLSPEGSHKQMDELICVESNAD